jgi:hypothetical protein
VCTWRMQHAHFAKPLNIHIQDGPRIPPSSSRWDEDDGPKQPGSARRGDGPASGFGSGHIGSQQQQGDRWGVAGGPPNGMGSRGVSMDGGPGNRRGWRDEERPIPVHREGPPLPRYGFCMRHHHRDITAPMPANVSSSCCLESRAGIIRSMRHHGFPWAVQVEQP